MKLISSDNFKIDDSISKQMYSIISSNMSNIVESNSTYNIWLNNCIKNNSIKTIICFINNTVIGYLQYTYNNKDIVLSEIQILKEYQGKGILKRLLKEFVSKINISFDSIITCHINPNNFKSKAVFKHIGFENTVDNIYAISFKKLLAWVEKWGIYE